MKFTKLFVLLIVAITISGMLLSKDSGEEHIIVCRTADKGILQMPLEEYMVGVMAASIPADYETECKKALAVVIRSNLINCKEGDSITVSENAIYFDYSQRLCLYGNGQKEAEELLRAAIAETGGMVMVSENQIVAENYHALSGGATRGEEGKTGAMCTKSMEATDFFFVTDIGKERMEIAEEIIRDEAGYVTEIKLDGKKISGEEFREQFGLPSANFEIEEQENYYVITCRGKGHGLGMDIYYANELAKQGYTYEEILKYFFKTNTLRKIIV